LAEAHQSELRTAGPALVQSLEAIVGKQPSVARRRR
jgi:hypothetical protein